MNYKQGDKVIIKNQDEAELTNDVEEWLMSLDPPRVVEIDEIGKFFYNSERYSIVGPCWLFEDFQIERIYDPILTRFEIIDL